MEILCRIKGKNDGVLMPSKRQLKYVVVEREAYDRFTQKADRLQRLANDIYEASQGITQPALKKVVAMYKTNAEQLLSDMLQETEKYKRLIAIIRPENEEEAL